MGQYLIPVAVIAVVSSRALCFPVDTEWKNPSGNASVCNYKGRSHADGEVINVDEPCLVCLCKKGALTCGLRICSDMPDPPPQGCYIVHNANQCCPQIVCHAEERESVIEVRTISDPNSNADVCIVNGSLYAEGSALESADKCEYCYCIQGQQKCIKPKCGVPFEGCKPIYTSKSCCPTQYDCRDRRTDVPHQHGKNQGCEINGVAYTEGAMLSANDSNCETCYCMKGQIRCVSVTCETKFTGDCEPVYESGRCCPTSYICSKAIMGISENSIRSFSKRLDSEERGTDDEVIVATTEAMTESTVTTSEYMPETMTSVEETVKSTMDDVDTVTENGLQKNFPDTTVDEATPDTEESTVLLTSPPNPTATDTISRNHVNFPTENRTEESTIPVPAPEDAYSNSPQVDDDYDSYDYNEPRLPPSLPNLIIFPFVAADAVVKDDETTKGIPYDESNIKRVGTEIPFYKDYFSPPTKTEGGFIPKQPPVITDTYQEFSAKDGTFPRPEIVIPSITVPSRTNLDQCIVKGRLREHGELLSEPGECQSCICYYGDVICHEASCPPLRHGCRRTPEKDVNSCCGKIICDAKDPSNVTGELEYHRKVEKSTRKPAAFEVTPNPYRDAIRTEPAPDIPLLMGDLVPLYVEHQTKKPVTVTYKNFIVDYYPDFLITTSRDDVRKKNYKNPLYITTEIRPLTEKTDTSAENVTYHTQPTVTTSISDDLEGDNSKYPYGKVRTSVRPVTTVATQPSRLFDYYTVEEYRPKEQAIRRTRPTRPVKKTTEASVRDDQYYTTSMKSTNSVKHKYSTKAKSTSQYKETQTKSTVEKSSLDDSFSLDSVLRFFFNTETTTVAPVIRHPSTRKTTKKEPVKKFTADPTEERVRQTTRTTASDHKYKESPDAEDSPKKHQSDMKKSNVGGLLKLAGCNIYGRMYRVGKIIAELSNPCLECVCTDVGVECNPLLC